MRPGTCPTTPRQRVMNTNIRLTTCLENLEMSEILTAVREMSGILLNVRELAGKNFVNGQVLFTVSCIDSHTRGSAVERQSLAGVLSPSSARPVADR